MSPAGSSNAPEARARTRIDQALAAPYKPLPFAYLSTGDETLFINHFDPHPRTRPVFSFHRPDIHDAGVKRVPPELVGRRIYHWTWENVKNFIDGL